jgi:predicted aminopeptidase
METMIGFVIGYYVGTRQGRQGLAQARESLEAIRRSPQTRELLAGAYASARPMIKQLASGGAGAVVSGAIEEISRRTTRA